MKTSRSKALLAGATMMLGLVTALAEEHHGDAAHAWTYGGGHGPSHWGEINAEFSLCRTGHLQSPIDIRDAARSDLPALAFDYHDTPLKIVNNGHTVMVNYAAGSSITVGGHRYDLVQFHFHHPSEEKIAGKQYAMVAHLVHKDSEGHLAVVAVLLEEGSAGNPLIDELWANLPARAEEEKSGSAAINVSQLLPADHGYYTFPGSLTTPPCSEGVTWFVLKTPVTVSAAQVKRFAAVYPNNARPVQAIAGRSLQQTK